MSAVHHGGELTLLRSPVADPIHGWRMSGGPSERACPRPGIDVTPSVPSQYVFKPRHRSAAPPPQMTTAQTRWLRILAAMGGREGPAPTPLGMCSAAADLLGAGGVGVFVMAKGVPGATFASNPLAVSLEELQFTWAPAQE